MAELQMATSQHVSRVLLVVWVLCATGALAERSRRTSDVPVVSASDLPIISPHDSLEVFYLEAPIIGSFAPSSLATGLVSVALLHAGLGFVVRSTGQQFTLQYYAPNGVYSAVFPSVTCTDYATMDNCSVCWDNIANIYFSAGIDSAYWVHATKVGDITGVQYAEWACWVPAYGTVAQYYQLFSVFSSFPNGPIVPLGSTCNDFIWSSLGAFTLLGGNMSSLVQLRKDMIVLNIGTHSMTLVDSSNATQMIEVYKFYAGMTALPTIAKWASISSLQQLAQIANWTLSYLYQQLNDTSVPAVSALVGNFTVNSVIDMYVAPAVAFVYDGKTGSYTRVPLDATNQYPVVVTYYVLPIPSSFPRSSLLSQNGSCLFSSSSKTAASTPFSTTIILLLAFLLLAT